MKRAVLIAAALGATSCYPFEPGSDLEGAPEPQLGSVMLGLPDMGALPDAAVETSTDVSGDFVATATLTPAVGDPVQVDYLFEVTQQGVILEGGASVDIGLAMSMAGFAMPAAVSTEGAFAGSIPGVVVSKSFTDLLAQDAMARIDLQGQILSSDCFGGPMTLTLLGALLTFNPTTPMDVVLEGTYRASREGTSGCTGGASAGMMGGEQ